MLFVSASSSPSGPAHELSGNLGARGVSSDYFFSFDQWFNPEQEKCFVQN